MPPFKDHEGHNGWSERPGETYGTMSLGNASPVETTLDRMYEQAHKAHPILKDLAQDIAQKFGGEAMVPGLKGRERALEKALAEYGGDATKLKDLARASVAFDSVDRVYEALSDLEQRFELQVKDRFAKPTAGGYRDVLVNFDIDGHTVELQLHHRGILAVKEGPGHKLYEDIRKITDTASLENRALTAEEVSKVDALLRESRKLYSEAIKD
ncbi:MAG: hypothetical protein WBV82_17805 [Myxococcaceae bacterium]